MTLGDWLSLLAFLVAALALWQSNIKRADLMVTVLTPDQVPEVRAQAWRGAWPENVACFIPLAIHNVGPRGGVLTALWLGALREEGHTPELFRAGAPTVMPLAGSRVPPEAFEGGDVKLYQVYVPLQLLVDAEDPGEILSRLDREASRLRVSLYYRYVKGRSLKSLLRRPAVVERRFDLSIRLFSFIASIEAQR